MESEPQPFLRDGHSIRWMFVSLATLIIILFPLKIIHEEPKAHPNVSGKTSLNIFRGSEPVISGTPAPVSAPVQPRGGEKHFHHLIVAASNKHSVDPALVKAIIKAESSYDPKAISRKGAVGLMQLMPGTADAMGVKDSLNPEHNINGGVKYLSQLLDIFKGDLRLAVAAYNAGITRVKKYQDVPPFKTTQFYVTKVFEYYSDYRSRM